MKIPEQGPIHTEDLQFEEQRMSIPGMLTPGAVVGELDKRLFVVFVDMAIAIDVVIKGLASMMVLYVRSIEGSCQRCSVCSGATI